MFSLTKMRQLRRLALGRAAFGLVALLSAGCTISPKPEPPAPPSEPPLIQLGDLTGHLAQHYGGGGFLEGAPGAANPAGATVRGFNLDSQEPASDALIAEDGSFDLPMLMVEGDEIRLQIISTEIGRSEPIDIVVGPSGSTPIVAVRPLADCLSLQPALEIDLRVQQLVSVHNQCSGSVSIEQPWVRRAIAGFEVGSGHSWPVELASGESVDVYVQFSAPAGTIEEIFFISASSPQNDRRPLTVYPTSGPKP